MAAPSDRGDVVIDADHARCRIEWWFVDIVEDRTAGERLGHVHEIPARSLADR